MGVVGKELLQNCSCTLEEGLISALKNGWSAVCHGSGAHLAARTSQQEVLCCTSGVVGCYYLVYL